jgi:hypothetical protein
MLRRPESEEPMKELPDIPEHGQWPGGVFAAGLSAYKSVSSGEYRVVLKSGLVVLDTNSLLDLYRYHEKTRQNFLSLYQSLGDHLWIPHHVMVEFFNRRTEVLGERTGYTDSVISELQGLVSKYNERLATWANRSSLAASERTKIAGIIDRAARQVEVQIRSLSRDDSLLGAEDTSRDPILAALEPILEGRVGPPLTPDELKEAKAEARRRIEDSRPPGFMDAAKKGENAEGDYLIWCQTLREAMCRRVDVLFVTRDQKKDWWHIEKGQAKGPRWELAAELENQAGVRLYMLRPPSLAEHAPEPLPEESVQDARRVSNKAYIGWRPLPGWGTVRDYVEIPRPDGKIDIAFRFIFDDGSSPQPVTVSGTSPKPEIAEYARGNMANGEITIKVGVDGMTQAEELFNEINAMEPAKRALMFTNDISLHQDCGYAWTPEYKLVKAAAGLVD